MQITRLRLLGFKSFVEPAELLVEPGLTGVVGPNGCGKSNLLEALRWVMGETSYKSMRGSGMDDVIFSGTDKRPARNMAEVTIFIDNSARTAPAACNDSDVIEISRRIQREAGSIYRLNGKEARARDVQILFADAATGARSQALVQQGQIGELVSAKPQDRRRILEDAAGIAGLHGRRHEAELRLKAAEVNLDRLQDVIGQIGTQLQNLRRQARQAQKYKEISAGLRKAEAIQHHLYWTAAARQAETEEAALLEALRAVSQCTQAESAALRAQAEAADILQPLRDEEAVRAAVLHRLEVERGALDREEARSRERQAELGTRLKQLDRDLGRENEQTAEARQLLQRLDGEERGLAAQDSGHGEARARAQAAAGEAAAILAAAENDLGKLTGETADLRAKRRHLEARIAEHEGRAARLAAQAGDIERQIAGLAAKLAQQLPLEALTAEVVRLSAALGAVESQALAAETAVTQARASERDTRDQAGHLRLKARQLETEAATLIKLLRPSASHRWRPVVDEIKVASGYEAALGAALGDDLDAPADQAAPVYWGRMPAPPLDRGDALLPDGAEPLSRFVTGPAELARRLAQTGIVQRADGKRLQAQLQQGQRLVSREGDLWRWDGFAAAADAPTAAAKRLAERNRLEDLIKHADDARAAADQADQVKQTSQEAAAAAQAGEKGLRELWRRAQAELGQARDALARAERAGQDEKARLAAHEEALRRTRQSSSEALEEKSAAVKAFAEASPLGGLEARLEQQKREVADKRSLYTGRKAALDGIEREVHLRQERLQSIARERERWSRRSASADEQIASLGKRSEEARAELASLAELPVKIASRRQKLLNEISQAEQARKQAGDRLAEAGNRLREHDRLLREAQTNLLGARENRARIEARLEAAREKRADQARVIRENLHCSPEECLAAAGLKDGEKLPPLPETEQLIVKLKGERERLGGVNLRAEEESGALAAEFDGLERERTDLHEAIARLRQGISNLNREGRKRLLEAFGTVNAHFQRLFKLLFSGGEAELQLIESDDPLESGLEILARPPGKKPQVLTLLSGGEKALTALSLIFAVFLTNPSPICVLDEVDAPLDDSNVDRFCRMMEEMARSTQTRFLVITHHPMTMSRMHRLFGVTMAEKGISQLVSVDLQTAERFREAV